MLGFVPLAAAARDAMPPPEPNSQTTLASAPLPRPRPAEAPQDGADPARGPAAPGPNPGAGSSPSAAPAPAEAERPPSACRLRLTDAVAIAPGIAPIHGPGECGGDDLVRLEAVVLPDRSRIAVKPAAILRCEMAEAVANWARTDMAALAASLGSTAREIDGFNSYECRGRNRIAGAKLSQHGLANALDIRSVKLADGRELAFTDRNAPRDMREKVMASACARFTTVLGPGSDGYHEDHIHLDLAERRNGYRICQWNILDGETQIAEPLPQPRPPEAPPREVASAVEIEQVKVQAVSPPAVSLSPVPLAQQGADVAKPLPPKPEAAPPRAAAREAKPAATPASTPTAITPQSKPQPPAADAALKGKTQRTAKRRTAARSRARSPDFPQVLRQIFD